MHMEYLRTPESRFGNLAGFDYMLCYFAQEWAARIAANGLAHFYPYRSCTSTF